MCFSPPILQDVDCTGEIYLLLITALSPPSHFLFLKEEALGKSGPCFSDCVLAEVDFVGRENHLFIIAVTTVRETFRSTVLAPMVAGGIVFRTFIWGYVYVPVCVCMCACIKTLHFRSWNCKSGIFPNS